MDLQSFSFNNQSIRVISMNGDPWFVAQDVCNILDLGNVSKACNPLKDREKNTITLSDGIAGNPTTLIISESGLYRLTMKSRKPQAEPFQDWVCEEILPSIRKTGKYEVIASQPEIKTSIPVIASRELALETARSVSEIKDLLADTDPRLCQLLVDVAINDAVNSIKAIAPASEAQWMGVAEIAEHFKLPVTPQNRTALGKFVKAACGNIGKQESRICNGRMMPIWCYPFPNSEVEKAVKNFFK
jgi:prophage antirepressor-like protein